MVVREFSLNEATIRGADSIDSVSKCLMKLGENAFSRARFIHDGTTDYIESYDRIRGIGFEYRARTKKAYLQVKYSGIVCGILELTQSTNPDKWKSINLGDIGLTTGKGMLQSRVFAFPVQGVKVRLEHRSNCGKRSNVVDLENEQFVERNIGTSILEIKDVEIVNDSGIPVAGNQTVQWRGMDFEPGDAKDNFDGVNLLHESSSDYIEFSFSPPTELSPEYRTGARWTIHAYCRKPTNKPARVKVSVDGHTKTTASISGDQPHWEELWRQAFMYTSPQREYKIRLQNAESPGSDSNISIENEITVDQNGKPVRGPAMRMVRFGPA